MRLGRGKTGTGTTRGGVRWGAVGRWAGMATLVWCLAGLTGPAAPLVAQGSDEAGVRRAALDYLEGFYEGSDEKLRRSIHPDVAKVGFSRPGPGEAYRTVPMSYEQMFQFAAAVRNGRNTPPAGAPKEVVLLDVLDQTAVAKVVAWWGVDYLQMARHDGRWMIRHVLWQSVDDEGGG